MGASNDVLNQETLQQIQGMQNVFQNFDGDKVGLVVIIIIAVFVFIKMFLPKIQESAARSREYKEMPMHTIDTGDDYWGLVYEPYQTEEHIRCAVVLDKNGQEVVTVPEETGQTIQGFIKDKQGLILVIVEQHDGKSTVVRWRFNQETLDFDELAK